MIEARGRTFMPPRRTTLSPHAQAQRSMVYSPNRILTPLKRVDLDPEGERNPQNRGVSGYEPITWDEALDLVTTELIRMKRENGPGAILTTCSSHHLWGNLGYRHSAYYRFLNLMGMVLHDAQPGQLGRLALGRDPHVGQQSPARHPRAVRPARGRAQAHRDDRLLVVRPRIHGRRHLLRLREHLPALLDEGARDQDGLRRSLLQPRPPSCSPTSGSRRDWAPTSPSASPSRTPGSTEGTYDKEYVAERTSGFDEWKDYVLGKSDDVPKTPEWAESECGIPAREIRALAREWGAKKIMLAAGGLGGWGGACRSATGNEWARTMVALAAMQGYGKPGSNIWGTSQGAPSDCSFVFPGYAEGGMSGDLEKSAAAYRMRLPDVRPQHRAAPDRERTRLHRGHRHPAPAHPRGDDAREVRVARQRLLRLVHREPDPEVPVPGAGLSLRHHVLALRRLLLRHDAADQPLREGLPRGQGPHSSSTSPSGWRARPSSPTSSCRPAPTSSAGT